MSARRATSQERKEQQQQQQHSHSNGGSPSHFLSSSGTGAHHHSNTFPFPSGGMSSPQTSPFLKQSVFLPIGILVAIILWLQFLPGNNNATTSTTIKTTSRDEIKDFIASEVRDHLINAANSKSLEHGQWPPVKVIPEGQRLRILVTGGSGFVGSHLVDRLMMAGHHVRFTFEPVHAFIHSAGPKLTKLV